MLSQYYRSYPKKISYLKYQSFIVSNSVHQGLQLFAFSIRDFMYILQILLLIYFDVADILS